MADFSPSTASPQGPWRFVAQALAAIAAANLSDLARDIVSDLVQLSELDRRLKKLGGQLLSICRSSDACRRIAKLPSVGPVIATALVAAIGDGRRFRSGRELSAWIGLTLRQYTTGSKSRLGALLDALTITSAADDPRRTLDRKQASGLRLTKMYGLNDSLLARFEATEAKVSKKRYVVELSAEERKRSRS